MSRSGQFLIVLSIILIMAGGILLTDNNMRELQGREKAHYSLDSLNGFYKNVKVCVKQVSKEAYYKAESLHSWYNKLISVSVDLISSIQETMEKLFERAANACKKSRAQKGQPTVHACQGGCLPGYF